MTVQHKLEITTLRSLAELFSERGCDTVMQSELLAAASDGDREFVKSVKARDLLVEIFRAVWKNILVKTEDRIKFSSDPRNTLTGIFAVMFSEFLEVEPALGRCIILECHRYDREKIRMTFMIHEVVEFIRVTEEYITQQCKAGAFLPINPSAVLELLLSVADGMMFAWFIRGEFSYPTKLRFEDFETMSRVLISSLFLPSTEQSKKYYDSVADQYEDLYTDGISLAENSIVGDMLADRLKPSARVLDLGCGTGLGYELLSQRKGANFEYVGIDISTGMIDAANHKFLGSENAKFHVMNIDNLAFFGDGQFDVCTSLFGSFSHVLNHTKAIGELHRLLKPHGKLFLMVYSRYSLRNFYSALTGFRPSLLSEVRPYEIRKTSGSIFADARFYTEASVRKSFSGFDDVTVHGLNCRLELPFFATRFRDCSAKQQAKRFLLNEMKRLSKTPNRCHSLIVEAIKPT